MLTIKPRVSVTYLGLGLCGLLGAAAGCGPEAPLAPPATSPIGALQQAEGLGKDGDVMVSTPATVVNRYAVLAADARRGDTTLSLSKMSGQGVDALLPLGPDDLLLIMQMQGADIDTTNSLRYGEVIDLRSAGLYEFIGVVAVDPITSKLTVYSGCGGLKNSYQAAGHVQVVRVPQYRTLTVAAGAGVSAPPWNGQTGGVVALQVRDTLTLDGNIDVSELGFRGGAQNVNMQLRLSGIGSFYRTMNALDGGNRGESIAGFETEYALTGQFGRGAAANGGGGGNRVAAGGGGGGGGGDVANWNGQGVMPLGVVGGGQAWPLDPGYDAARTKYAGGGRGGYTYSGAALDPTTVAPGDKTWSEDFRRERGGLGGRPLPSDPKIRLFLGGGGGSGDDYQGASGVGGSGGGLVFIDARKVTGAGQIAANGQDGYPATAVSSGAGGGGGGGTVVVASSAPIDGITIQASGGNGGDQQGAMTMAGGPGGGGGGGYIATQPGLQISQTVPAGTGGSTESTSLVGFPRNGASDGAPGQLTTTAVGPYGGAPYCSVADLAIAITATPTQATERQPFQLAIQATNKGPSASGNAVVRLDLPEGVTLERTDAPGWECQPTTTRLTCQLANFPIGAAPGITATLIPALGAQSMTFTTSLSAPTTDLDMSNNTASVTVENPTPLVARPAGGGLSCTLTAAAPGAASGGLWWVAAIVAGLGAMRRRLGSAGARRS